jgi:hypothetical protein
MNSPYQWCVIGAGAAGILAIGKLLDEGIDAKTIVWLDDGFNAGDLSNKWPNVPSNTKVKPFTKYLEGINSFNYKKCPADLSMNNLDPEKTCQLSQIVKPLLWISQQLQNKVQSIKTTAKAICLSDALWEVATDTQTIAAEKIILALGANEKQLPHPGNEEVIPLVTALNPEKLKACITTDDCVAVYGASHSGILVLKNLSELGCNIVNFYKHPLRYAIDQGDHIIFDNTGLKGDAATWAKANLCNNKLSNIQRYSLDHCDVEQTLKLCNKIIDCVGFSPRTIDIQGINTTAYDCHTGIIAPGLFGFGLSHPELVTSVYGHQEYNVGLFKFFNYINKVWPLWADYGVN